MLSTGQIRTLHGIISVFVAIYAIDVPVSYASEPHRLTFDGRQKMDTVFIRHGEELVFTVQESPTQFCLMRLNLASGKTERLHPDATTSQFEPAFSLDGRYCAFVQCRANLNLVLIIRDTKQKRENVFDPGGGFAGMHRPSIAPDGSRLIFSMPGGNGQQVYSINTLGRDRKSLTQAGINNWPAFSPDGRRIAFTSSRDGDFEIYAMDADGKNVRRLTKSPGLDIRPAWSADAKRIAFTSNRDGNYEIYAMNADGSKVRRVTHHPERDDYAAWHPDGRHLAIVSERAGQSDIYLVDVPE
jgi:Tol biopolymer transport system component